MSRSVKYKKLFYLLHYRKLFKEDRAQKANHFTNKTCPQSPGQNIPAYQQNGWCLHRWFYWSMVVNFTFLPPLVFCIGPIVVGSFLNITGDERVRRGFKELWDISWIY